jgi:hypothetical protein
LRNGNSVPAGSAAGAAPPLVDFQEHLDRLMG